MNRPAQKIRILFASAALFAAALSARAARATISTYTGHDYVSVVSTVSVSEQHPVQFGNFTVTSPGDNGASLTLTYAGARSTAQTGTTTITLVNGGVSDLGAQSQGIYQVSGAVANATIYVTFTDHTGTAISSTNPVVLTGPVGSGTFNVDTMSFNSSGSDVNGPYILADASGNASIQVGATLHTVSGVSTYAPGTYRGTFDLIISY